MKQLLTLALIVGSASAFAQNTPPKAIPQSQTVVDKAKDELSGNWAKQAIEIVVAKGLFVGYPEGTFDWRQDATRQEVAMVFARLLQVYPLDQLQNMMSKDDFDTLLKGLDEVRNGLKEVQARLAEHEKTIGDMQNQLDDLQAQLDGLDGLGDRVTALEKSQAEQDGRLDNLDDGQAEQNNRLDELEAGQTDQDDRLDNLDDGQAEQNNRLDELEAGQTDQDGRLDNLEKSLENLLGVPADLANLKDRMSALEQRPIATSTSGTTGSQGSQGLQGPKGDKGDTGDVGTQGPKGDKGDTGDVGAQGPKGDKGDTGDVGAQGPKGDKGDTGNVGAQGPKGDKGDKGDMGPQGPAGKDFTPPVEAPRNAFYLGFSGYGVGAPSKGKAVRLMAGNDSLVGNFGVRVTGDFGVEGNTAGTTVAALATYRTTLGRIDGYAGIGAGQNLDTSIPFGDLTLGVDVRLFDFLAIFAEGRQNFYFDDDTSLNSVVFGAKIRF